jgi:flagellar motor switch protein FliM
MDDVLDQKELDALLAAVDGGQVDLAEAPAGPYAQEVALYDFRRPERVSKDHLRALEGLHEGFARTLGASLSSFLRTIVDVRVVSVEQCSYGEFILSLPNPTCFFLLGAKPMEGNPILELNPGIVFPILDWLLGGGREPVHVPQRPVTEIEQRLVNRLVERALKALAESWSAVQEIELAVLQNETNPQLIQVLPAGEGVVLLTFEITIGEASGLMNLCLPFAVIEPIMNRIVHATQADYLERQSDPRIVESIAQRLDGAPVELAVHLAQTAITVGDLLHLAVGDVLKTEKPADATMLVTVEGRPKFRGLAVQHRGRKAVHITAPAGPRDRI